MTLSLTTAGRFFDNFTRANSTTLGNGWTEQAGDWSIVSNTLRVTVAAGGSANLVNAFSALDTLALLTHGGNGIGGKYVEAFIRSGANPTLGSYSSYTDGGTVQGINNNGKTFSQSATIAAYVSGGIIGVSAIGAGASIAIVGYKNGSVALSGNDTNADRLTAAGYAGIRVINALGTTQTFIISGFEARSRANVLVTSLLTGYYARLTDGVNVVDAAASSGTATITPSAAQGFGPWTLRIYDANPTTTGVQQGADQTGVYGGDSWAGSGFVTNGAITQDATLTQAIAGIALQRAGAVAQSMTLVQDAAGYAPVAVAQSLALAQGVAGMALQRGGTVAQDATLAANVAGHTPAHIAQSLMLTQDATGVLVASTIFEGALAQALALTQSVTGHRAVEFGAVAQSLALAATISGSVTKNAAVAQVLTLAQSTEGFRTPEYGAALQSVALAVSVAGIHAVESGAVDQTLTLTQTATGYNATNSTLGAVAQAFTFTQTPSGMLRQRFSVIRGEMRVSSALGGSMSVESPDMDAQMTTDRTLAGCMR